MAPDVMVIGVKIHNLTHSTINKMHMNLLDMCGDSEHKTDMSYHSKALCVHGTPSQTQPSMAAPQVKKPRKEQTVCVKGISSLSHNNMCHIVTETVIPTFDYSSSRTFMVLLIWSSSRGSESDLGGKADAESTYYDSLHRRTHTMDCGRIKLTVNDVYQTGPGWIHVNDLLHPVVDERLVLCLETVQQTRRLELSCLHSNLYQDLRDVLSQLSFRPVSQIGGYVCEMTGPLQWTRVDLQQPGKRVMYINVSTRNNHQFFLLTHALYSKLPDDVIIEATNKQLHSIAISDSIRCLSEEASSTERLLSNLLTAGSRLPPDSSLVSCNNETGSAPDDTLVSSNTTLARVAFESRREAVAQREQLSVDVTKMTEVMCKRKLMRQRTDGALHHVAHLNI